MGFWGKLLGSNKSGEGESEKHTGTIEEMSAILDDMDSIEAQKLAGLAYLMARVAHSDLDIDTEELKKIAEIVKEFTDLSDEKTEKLVQLARRRNELLGTEGFVISRHLRKISSGEELTKVLHCLFAVAGADDSISAEEEASLRQISSELGFSSNQFVMIRSKYRDKRDVLK